MGEWIFWVPSVRNGVHDRTREEHLPQGNPEVLWLLVPLTALSTDFPSVISGSQERELERPASERPSERIQGDKAGVGGAELGREREQGESHVCHMLGPLSPFFSGTVMPICCSGIHGQCLQSPKPRWSPPVGMCEGPCI